jgi:L-rhamnose mutarotase
MERVCFTFEIYPGAEDEYKKRHDEIWPELVAAIKAAGQSNYTLFRHGNTVVGYLECEPDAATAFTTLAATDVNQRWSEWMKDVIATPRGEDGGFQRLDEVWHLA